MPFMTGAAVAPWRGPAQFAAIALAVTLAALWLNAPAASCTRRFEPHQHMDLGRVVDQEHLAADLRDADRVALRYAAHLAIPAADAGKRCQATLDGQIMTMHDVTAAQIRSAR
jgi:hypothetical protein